MSLAVAEDGRSAAPHAGMPPLDLGRRPLSYFEFWPTPVFYFPVGLYWVWLALKFRGITVPTSANPGLPAGGFVGESKSEVLGAAGAHAQQFISPFVTVHREAGVDGPAKTLSQALRQMEDAGLSFPVVAKPDISCRGAGVQVMRGPEHLSRYLSVFPEGARLLLQRLVDKEGEAGVFYIRHPDDKHGHIPSLTLKYFPHVLGDGVKTLEDLIAADTRAGAVAHLYRARHAHQLGRVLAPGERLRLVFAGNHARGTIFRNGTALVNEALRARIDSIARDIPGFHFGRFDIRFHDFEAFLKGEDLTIIEVNGAGAEMTHIWDKDTKLSEAYRALFHQYHSAFAIGAANRALGARPMRLAELVQGWWRERQLTPLYPATD